MPVYLQTEDAYVGSSLIPSLGGSTHGTDEDRIPERLRITPPGFEI
jgi:hypothetical protein